MKEDEQTSSFWG